MTKNYLTSSRHGTVFYFRRRVPDDLKHIIGKPCVVKSLGTNERRLAIILARAYAAKTDTIFRNLRSMNKNNDKGTIFEYAFVLELDDFGVLRKIEVEADPDETVALESAIRTTLANLPRHSVAAIATAPTNPLILENDCYVLQHPRPGISQYPMSFKGGLSIRAQSIAG